MSSSFLVSLRRKIARFWLIRLKPLLGLDTNRGTNPSSDVPLDVVIPALGKDIEVLPHTISYLRANLRHPIQTIFIVAPKSDKAIQKLANELDCTFTDEATVVPIAKTAINYRPNGQDRSGWLYQQLIKLNTDSFTTSNNILVLDSDTLLIRPQVMLKDERPIFNHSDEQHAPYYSMYQRLIGQSKRYPLSFVSHYMVLNRTELQNLKKHVEQIHNTEWYQAILQTIDTSESSGFSEYETYGNFYTYHVNKKCIHEYWFNISLSRQKLPEVSKLVDEHKGYYKSLSFHSYNSGAEVQ